MYWSAYELEWLAQARIESCISDARQAALLRFLANNPEAGPGRSPSAVGRVMRVVSAPFRVFSGADA